MIPGDWLVLSVGGLVSGVLAGVLGIGGGALIVPLLVFLGYLPVQAVATSSLAILATSLSGSIQNWRMGYFDPKKILYLGIPAVLTTQIGVFLASRLVPWVLLFAFGISMLVNIYLVDLRRTLATKQAVQPPTEIEEEPQAAEEKMEVTVVPVSSEQEQRIVPIFSEPKADAEIQPQEQSGLNPSVARAITGGSAGLLAGLFGIGGGVIMVPLQVLLLGENIKVAAQTSLGVIVLAAIFACTGHALHGNILLAQGAFLSVGGLIGAQFGTRFLPKLSDEFVGLAFKSTLGILAVYVFIQAWIDFNLR